MKFTKKAEKIVEESFNYLENNYKGSEITFDLMLRNVLKKCDSRNCEEQVLKYLWENWEFYDREEYDYFRLQYKEIYNINVK